MGKGKGDYEWQTHVLHNWYNISQTLKPPTLEMRKTHSLYGTLGGKNNVEGEL